MNMRDLILWQPAGARGRVGVFVGAVGATLALGYLHLVTGLAYEFHVFFTLPVLVAAWYAGGGAGLWVALLAVLLWFLTDRHLGGDQADPFPLLINTGTRLAIFLGGAWLLAAMRRVLEREARLAREDPLTRLPNRREFQEQGRRCLAQARREGSPVTAVFIDLDRFKQVNDERGHEVGDVLLKTVADGLRAHLRAGDIPGRLGGDEFALLLPGMDERGAVAYVGGLRQRLLGAMADHG